jgi:hypothetical protein
VVRPSRTASRLAPVAALLLLITGCAGTAEPGSPSATPTTTSSSASPSALGGAELTIALDETGEGAVTTYTLTCEPAGGDHPEPEAACRALEAAGGAAAMAEPPRDQVCTDQYGGPQTAAVRGTIGGEPVQASFSRTNGCEISRWDALAPLLGSPGGV